MSTSTADTLFFEQNLPFYKALSAAQKALLGQNARFCPAAAGSLFCSPEDHCLGVVLVKSGQLRAYLSAPNGRELTLYFLGKNELSMLAASCILQNAVLPISLAAVTDSELLVIPPLAYNALRRENPAVERYTTEVLGQTFAAVMQTMEQILFLPLEERLALFLLERFAFEQKPRIAITQEAIAQHLGSAREVISRLLAQIEAQGHISVVRGGVVLRSEAGLSGLVRALP